MSQQSNVWTYDIDDLIIVIGAYEFKNFGSDGAITISRNNPVNEKQEGLMGDTTVNKNRKLGGQVTITLPAHSDGDQLMDQIASVLTVPVPLIFKLPSANKQLIASAWYEEQPDLSIGAMVDDRAHVFGVNNASLSLLDTANNAIDQVETLFGQ